MPSQGGGTGQPPSEVLQAIQTLQRYGANWQGGPPNIPVHGAGHSHPLPPPHSASWSHPAGQHMPFTNPTHPQDLMHFGTGSGYPGHAASFEDAMQALAHQRSRELGEGPSNRGRSQSAAPQAAQQPTLPPAAQEDEEEDEQALSEDKRRRNTAASGKTKSLLDCRA